MRILEVLSDDFDKENEADRKHFAEFKVAKNRYDQLISDLSKIEEETGLYLVDTNVDHENTQDGGLEDQDSKDYWESMYSSACMNAGTRAAEAGKDINKLLGQKIY